MYSKAIFRIWGSLRLALPGCLLIISACCLFSLPAQSAAPAPVPRWVERMDARLGQNPPERKEIIPRLRRATLFFWLGITALTLSFLIAGTVFMVIFGVIVFIRFLTGISAWEAFVLAHTEQLLILALVLGLLHLALNGTSMALSTHRKDELLSSDSRNRQTALFIANIILFSQTLLPVALGLLALLD